MTGKQSTGSKNTANDTGKTGNASGSRVKQAQGPSYDERHGTIYKDPKDLHPPGKR